LGEGEHRALLVHDDKANPAAVRIEMTTQNRGDTLAINLAVGGGFIARFSGK
jgi:hypothetical protein